MIRRRKISGIISNNKDLTDFEKCVYRAVAKIPSGEVRSYKWVANAIGRPYAVRAVGNALHKNPYSLTVPCHRVIKSDGSIGGYAGGASKKMEMLLSEGVDCSAMRCYNRRKG